MPALARTETDYATTIRDVVRRNAQSLIAIALGADPGDRQTQTALRLIALLGDDLSVVTPTLRLMIANAIWRGSHDGEEFVAQILPECHRFISTHTQNEVKAAMQHGVRFSIEAVR